MPYTKLHTEALILRSFDAAAADRTYLLFTRELGRVYARAKSVREQSSKMRGTLEQFGHIDVSLISGKGGWKITNTQERTNLFYVLREERTKQAAVVRVLQLLDRLLQGEEHAPRLFDIVTHGIGFIQKEKLSHDEMSNLEILLVMRILKELGLLGNTKFFEYLLTSQHVNEMLLSEVNRTKPRMVQEINRSLRELQL